MVGIGDVRGLGIGLSRKSGISRRLFRPLVLRSLVYRVRSRRFPFPVVSILFAQVGGLWLLLLMGLRVILVGRMD